MNQVRLAQVREKIQKRINARIVWIEQAIRAHRQHVDRFETCCKGKILLELAEAHLADAYRLEAHILSVYGELNILRRALED